MVGIPNITIMTTPFPNIICDTQNIYTIIFCMVEKEEEEEEEERKKKAVR